MGVWKDISTIRARQQASDATETTIFKLLENYIDEAKSYGDELEIDTFYDSFREYYSKNKYRPL